MQGEQDCVVSYGYVHTGRGYCAVGCFVGFVSGEETFGFYGEEGEPCSVLRGVNIMAVDSLGE